MGVVPRERVCCVTERRKLEEEQGREARKVTEACGMIFCLEKMLQII